MMKKVFIFSKLNVSINLLLFIFNLILFNLIGIHWYAKLLIEFNDFLTQLK